MTHGGEAAGGSDIVTGKHQLTPPVSTQERNEQVRELSLKFSPTNEVTITSKLGTSLKPGWEGAELRAVLVRKAAGVAAKDDKEDEEDDA